MSIETLGYQKALQAGNMTRKTAEDHATAMKEEILPQVASKFDLELALAKQTVRLVFFMVGIAGLQIAGTGLLLTLFRLFPV